MPLVSRIQQSFTSPQTSTGSVSLKKWSNTATERPQRLHVENEFVSPTPFKFLVSAQIHGRHVRGVEGQFIAAKKEQQIFHITFTCATADIEWVSQGDSVTLEKERTYHVVDHQLESAGLSILILAPKL